MRIQSVVPVNYDIKPVLGLFLYESDELCFINLSAQARIVVECEEYDRSKGLIKQSGMYDSLPLQDEIAD